MAPLANGWACYYENLNNKSGCHDNDYKDPSKYIDLDRAILIFMNFETLMVITDKF